MHACFPIFNPPSTKYFVWFVNIRPIQAATLNGQTGLETVIYERVRVKHCDDYFLRLLEEVVCLYPQRQGIQTCVHHFEGCIACVVVKNSFGHADCTGVVTF